MPDMNRPRLDDGGATPENDAAIKDSPLDTTRESEGGFPCGEFLWDEEEEEAVPAPPAGLPQAFR